CPSLSFCRQSAPTWWFDMTRPYGDTKDPEPPLLKRTEDFCTWSSHSLVSSNPYFSLSCLRGGLLKSHMPSSAWTETGRGCDNTVMDKMNVNLCQFIFMGGYLRFICRSSIFIASGAGQQEK